MLPKDWVAKAVRAQINTTIQGLAHGTATAASEYQASQNQEDKSECNGISYLRERLSKLVRDASRTHILVLTWTSLRIDALQV